MKKNFTGEDKLLHDLNQLAAHTNEGGYKTRAAYKSHMRNLFVSTGASTTVRS